MKILIVISTLLIFWAEVGQAQKLSIRSGEHPSFSRLTIPLSTSQSWSLDQTAENVIITLPNFSGKFDLSQIFQRIQRNRISEITTSGSTLELTLNCDCQATAFKTQSLLVLDVTDMKQGRLETTLQGSKRPQERTNSKRAKDVSNSSAALPWIGGNSPFSAANLEDGFSSSTASIVTFDAQLENRTEILQRTQKALLEDVAKAASSGLLENSYISPRKVKQQVLNLPSTVEIVPLELLSQIETPEQNVRITNSMAQPNSNSPTLLSDTDQKTSCPPDGILAVDTWGDDTGFSAQIGPARNALMNARDRLDKDAAKQLVKLYIYFGFGAEAAEVLRLDPELEASNPHLLAASQILEHGSAKGHKTIGKYADCDSDVALWASLSFEVLPAGFHIDTNAALRALNRLPKQLRQILAPALSEQFLQFGETAAAATAMRSIERLIEPMTSAAKMAQADLAIDAGHPVEEVLIEMIGANSNQSPEALVKLVEGKLARGEPLEYETATLVEAYVQELRGTPIGNQLRQTQVIALSQAQHFTEAFDALEAVAPSLSRQANLRLTQEVLKQLGKNAENVVFLEHVFAVDPQTITDLSISTKLVLASRVMDLGFALQAQEMIASTSDSPRNTERQLLAARAALGLNQPFQAQAALIGIKDPQAALLMAEAKEMAGAYAEASQIYSENNASEQATQAAWLADDWSDLIPEDTPEFGAIASLVLAKPSIEEIALGQLGRADHALQESSNARTTLKQLLSDTAIQ